MVFYACPCLGCDMWELSGNILQPNQGGIFLWLFLVFILTYSGRHIIITMFTLFNIVNFFGRGIALIVNSKNHKSNGEHTLTEKQKRKRDRTKTYFLEAAKDMITNQGVESVTVRKIAEAAGYSYPTLYNYFQDLNELLWETKEYMILDLVKVLQNGVQYPLKDPEELKGAFKTYIQYYLEYPNVFKFFYLFPMKIPEAMAEDAPVQPDFSAIWYESFHALVKSGRLKQKDIETVAKTLIYAIHGMLMLRYSNNGDLSDAKNLYRNLDQIIDYLL